MKNIYQIRKLLLWVVLVSTGFFSCNNEDNTLAPYTGSPPVSNITVQAESFNPKITWLGGYVSVFGINKGNSAALDSTLVWLVHTNGNNIHYPLVACRLPEGAQDITAQYGGLSIDSLQEDQDYTFWVLKEDVWNQISSYTQFKLAEDSSASASFRISGDSLLLSAAKFEVVSEPINVYINILDIRKFGPLADVNVETTTMNVPKVTWTIKAPGAVDSMVAAIGFAGGTTYDASTSLWEVYSERDSAGIKIYVKDNVIKSPVIVSETLPNTRAFVVYNPQNLVRNAYYHVWIADKTWDRVNRQRFTPGYAYVTFRIE